MDVTDEEGGGGPDAPSRSTGGKSSGGRPRTIKTNMQKEVLEASYRLNPFPSEEHRRALGERIGLTEPQVQVWFTNRRRKDKKQQEAQQQATGLPTAAVDDAAYTDEAMPEIETHAPVPPPAKPVPKARKPKAATAPLVVASPVKQNVVAPPHKPAAAIPPPRFTQTQTQSFGASPNADFEDEVYPVEDEAEDPAEEVGPSELPQEPVEAYDGEDEETEEEEDIASARKLDEMKDLIELAKATLPVPFRDDGPPLAYEFDDIPTEPKAAGSKRKRIMIEGYVAEADEGVVHVRKRKPPAAGALRSRPGMNAMDYEMKLDQKRRAELGKAERKRVGGGPKVPKGEPGAAKTPRGGPLKENERLERERQRQEERAEKERQREEARKAKEAERQRVAQERELKRLEQRMEKERRAEERRKQAEERKRERDTQRALAQQEKAFIRQRQREAAIGPPDDLDLEWEKLLEAAGIPEGTYSDDEHEEGEDRPAVPERPEFPPPSLELCAAFPPELGDELGPELLLLWSFIHSFSDLLGIAIPTTDELLQALVDGADSPLLASLHVALLRLWQADMEGAHALPTTTQGGAAPSTAGSKAAAAAAAADKAAVDRAQAVLDEARSWGFDVDVWRAHLNVLTWPEVLRQVMVSMGYGGKRPKPKVGKEREDIFNDESGVLRLKLPGRFAAGTVKAAAWLVLAEAGPEGMSVPAVTNRIQQSGLRDLSTTKTPEASVAAALSRDEVFARVAPATYALKSVVNYHRSLHKEDKRSELKLKPEPTEGTPPESSSTPPVPGAPGSQENGVAEVKAAAEVHVMKEEEAAKAATPAAAATAPQDHQEDEDEESDDDDEGEAGRGAAPWLCTLLHSDYNALALPERLAVLGVLVQMCLDGPSVRRKLEQRADTLRDVKKVLWEDAKAEKKKRLDEVAAKAKVAAALEAQRKLAEEGEEGEGAAAQAPLVEEDAAAAEADRLRSQQRAEELQRVEEAYAVRMEPLGMDRRYNRYWHFTVHGRDDPGTGRLYVEAADGSGWRLLADVSQLEAVLDVLEPRGAREGALHSALLRCYDALVHSMPATPVEVPGHSGCADDLEEPLQEAAVRFCPAGHSTAQLVARQPTDTCRTQRLKQNMLSVAASVPAEMLLPGFDPAAWQSDVERCSGLLGLRRCLGRLEAALVGTAVSPAFQREFALVKGAWVHSKQHGEQHHGENGTAQGEAGSSGEDALHWLPATPGSLGLRVLALDAALSYQPGSGFARDTALPYRYSMRPLPPATDALGVPPRVVPECPLQPGARVRPPALPLARRDALQAPPQAFQLPVEELRRGVDEAEAMGALGEDGEDGASVSGRGRGRGRGRGYTSLSGRGAGRGRGRGKPRVKKPAPTEEWEREEEDEPEWEAPHYPGSGQAEDAEAMDEDQGYDQYEEAGDGMAVDGEGEEEEEEGYGEDVAPGGEWQSGEEGEEGQAGGQEGWEADQGYGEEDEDGDFEGEEEMAGDEDDGVE